MTPKEKANQLLEKFHEGVSYHYNSEAVQCCIWTVENIIDNYPFRDYGFNFDSISKRLDESELYWKEVKKELLHKLL